MVHSAFPSIKAGVRGFPQEAELDRNLCSSVIVSSYEHDFLFQNWIPTVLWFPLWLFQYSGINHSEPIY